MVTIGGLPMLWHIMQIYARFDITDFIIRLGYKGHPIKDYFSNFSLYSASVVTFDLKTHETSYEYGATPVWKVTLVETGEKTETGGRIKRVNRWVENGEFFCLTYGDGVSDVDIGALIAHHRKAQAGRNDDCSQPRPDVSAPSSSGRAW
jgi:glucose-1-phosphate cytidylyltransferase